MSRIKKTRKYRKKSAKRKQRGGNINTKKIEHFIERLDKNAPKEVSGVPLVIYRTSSSYDIPEKMFDIIMNSVNIAPEFDNYMYTDEDCLKFIEKYFADEPNIANAYRCLKPGAYKADLWRYCVLYKKGGVYIDVKLELKVPLFDILKNNPYIYIYVTSNGKKMLNDIYNGFMASPPNNPIIKDCIDEIVENCKTKNYRTDCLDVTGPFLLGRMVQKHNGNEFSLPFTIENTVSIQKIMFNDTEIALEYQGYRDFQKQKSLPRYCDTHFNRDIFDTSIIFV